MVEGKAAVSQAQQEDTFKRAISAHLDGDLQQAYLLYNDVLTARPDHADANHNLGVVLALRQQKERALYHFDRALDANPFLPQFWLSKIKILVALNKRSLALRLLDELSPLKLKDQRLHDLGSQLRASGCQSAQVADTENPSQHQLRPLIDEINNKKYDNAVRMCWDFLKRYPNSWIIHNILGAILSDIGEPQNAISPLKKSIKLKPNFSVAHYNLANALAATHQLSQAVDVYHLALRITPDYFSALYNLAIAYRKLGNFEEALRYYDAAILINPKNASCHYDRGNALKAMGRLGEAIAAYSSALEIDTALTIAEEAKIHLRLQLCDFSIDEELAEVASRLGIDTAAVAPFSSIVWADNPAQQIARVKNFVHAYYSGERLAPLVRPPAQGRRIKVGYFSSDVHDHATMHLLSGVFRNHDRSRFEVYLFSYGRKKPRAMHAMLRQQLDHFYDVEGWSDAQILERVRGDCLDIAIDLKGYTENSRSELFKSGLAPVQVNYLGFPGSMGAPFMDYMIADPVVIPQAQRAHYSEKIIFLPHCYQPNDNARIISSRSSLRRDHSLPSDKFIYCCFNNNYKITKQEMAVWMNILNRVPESVLWLLEPNRWAKENILREADRFGVMASRIVWAPRLPSPDHLARHQHADLFLDTFNCNAHTTASDALWAGLPLLTLTGKQFAARVATSLLNAAGIPELAVSTVKQYEDLAVSLAADKARMLALRNKLAMAKKTSPLFDSETYTRHLEIGLERAVRGYYANETPVDIVVPV